MRNVMRPALRRNFQPIALRIIAEGGGEASVDRIRQAIGARHPETKWDRRYPLDVLQDNGIIEVDGATARLSEELDATEIASLLAALDERSVRTSGLRVEDTSWRPDNAEWQLLRDRVVARDGERCAVAGCQVKDDLELDHVWRGSILAAIGRTPSAINDPKNLQLLCAEHHADKTRHEAALLAATDDEEQQG